MSGYLIDTSILSTLAPDRPPIPRELSSWIIEQGERGTLFTSAIVVLEIRRGIASLKRAGGSMRAERLAGWLGSMIEQFEENLLAVDTAVAISAGDLEDEVRAKGRSPGTADILIAATARVHELTVLTANARHFDVVGVNHFDPFKADLPR
ncbi:type II toxin-antitoxin system VapC family toxin [Mesorhizobium australicum]|uniref:Ribonuclease VapC n=1 Tax=Mesorhizobium australicum TaxID=536018 RepID=A0A1X7Q040_9HYPH|nr:type II toxin-antitoxin system VapC family toxin [Mesorhizobium australicum]SMH57294.1 hypothetical protein SAMN02982922_5734 [Mesorhizobium australicum]